MAYICSNEVINPVGTNSVFLRRQAITNPYFDLFKQMLDKKPCHKSKLFLLLQCHNVLPFVKDNFAKMFPYITVVFFKLHIEMNVTNLSSNSKFVALLPAHNILQGNLSFRLFRDY